MMKNENVPNENESVCIQAVSFSHKDIYNVVNDFYGRIQADPILQIPFDSVENWPDHVERLTHFWWARFGGKPYLDYQYNPGVKHFRAGFDRDLLTRWLGIFHDTLSVQLKPDQIELWAVITERMGEALSLKNEIILKHHEQRACEADSSATQMRL